MMMHDEVKKIEICEKCHGVLNDAFDQRIAIRYKDRYLCTRCYKRELSVTPQVTLGSEGLWEKQCKDFLKGVRKECFFTEVHKFEEKKKESLTPREIVAYLDKNIVGQEDAKRALAVAVCNHYMRINAGTDDVKIPKSNVLMEGPTGCGKTYILKTLAELLDVPFFVADTSVITEAGYKGNDIESVVTGLYQAADGDVEKTQKGIIYLDEFDKLSSKYGHSSSEESSVGAGVQRQLLKMLEGCVMDVPKTGYRKSGDSVRIDTENILFICGGAFVGLHPEKNTKSAQAIGFASEVKAKEHPVAKSVKSCPQDFVDFGLIPEIVGRLPIIVSLNDLTEQDLVSVLKNTEKSLIKKYALLFERAYDVELVFEDEAVVEIAHQAYIRKTGARGLNAIVEGIMQELLFDIPSEPSIRKCVITKEAVQGSDRPQLFREEEEIRGYAS